MSPSGATDCHGIFRPFRGNACRIPNPRLRRGLHSNAAPRLGTHTFGEKSGLARTKGGFSGMKMAVGAYALGVLSEALAESRSGKSSESGGNAFQLLHNQKRRLGA